MTTEREEAWRQLLDATPPGWYIGQPSYHGDRGAPTEVEVVLKMAGCPREMAAGRVPR